MEQLRLVLWIPGDVESQLEEANRLLVRTEPGRTHGGALEQLGGVRSDLVGVGVLWRAAVRVEVVRGGGVDDLVVLE
jgi:hypothetical protein